MAMIAKELTVKNEAPHVYKELDQIRLVYEDGDLIGWYRPGGDPEAAKAREVLGMLKMVGDMLE